MGKRFCVLCGADISESAVFCEKCGAKQPAFEHHSDSCTFCGAVLQEDASFCSNCGAQTGQPSDARVRQVRVKNRNLKTLIASATTFLLALIMLVIAFLPVATYDFSEVAGLDGFELSFSPFDHIVLLFDSMKSMDEEDLAESDLFEEGQEVSEDLAAELYGQTVTEYDDLDREAKKLLKKLIFLTLRVGMSSEMNDGSMGPFLATATILSVIYVLSAIALAVVSVFYLLSSLGVLFKEKAGALKNATLALFFLLPALLLVRWIAENVIWSPTGTSDLTVASIFVLLLSVVALSMHMLVHLLNGGTFTKRMLIPRAVSSALAILLIIAMFMPAVNVRIKEQFDGRTNRTEAVASMPAILLGSFWLSDSDEEMYDSMQDTQDSDEYAEELKYAFDFSYYTRKDVEKGNANIDIFYAMFVIGAPYGFHEFSWTISMTAFLVTLAVLSAMLVLWQNMLYFAGGRASRLVIRLSKICSCMLTVSALVLVIVFLAMMTLYLDADLPEDARFSVMIGAGLIVATVTAIAQLFIPSRVCDPTYEDEVPFESFV